MPIKLDSTPKAAPKPPQARPHPQPQHELPNPFQAQRNLAEQNLKNVKKIIAVHSGKGGVGKSFFAINLAASLTKLGFSAGIVDADVDCPSCHKMLGNSERAFANPEGRLLPLEAHGIKFLSVGSMVESENSAQIMRGPIMFKLISEMLYKADWGALDYLIIDLPPGTGDNPLTIMQIAPLYGIIIVTQPQEVALVDARKSIDMAKRMNVAIIGIVENMSGEIFGEGNAERMAQRMQQNFLGSIPLQQDIRILSDLGIPPVLKDEILFEKFKAIIAEGAL